MKVFDYKCNDCGKVEERFVTVHGDTDESFPVFRCECEGIMTKQLSAPTAVLDNSFPGAAIKRGKK